MRARVWVLTHARSVGGICRIFGGRGEPPRMNVIHLLPSTLSDDRSYRFSRGIERSNLGVLNRIV
jgi:hypothetical protein